MDPNFVVIAQCYAGEASNGGLKEALARMRTYKEIGEVDWVQFTAPRTVDEVLQARHAVAGPFSIMTSFLPQTPTHQQLLDWGINLAWMPRPTHMVTYAALYDYVQDFMARGTAATEDFQERHRDNPYVNGRLKIGGAQVGCNESWRRNICQPNLWRNTAVLQGKAGAIHESDADHYRGGHWHGDSGGWSFSGSDPDQQPQPLR